MPIPMARRGGLLAIGCALAVLAAACSGGGDAPDLAARRDGSARDATGKALVTIRALDEAGAPVDATFTLSNGWVYEADETGRVVVAATQPVSGLVSAEGFLTEPILVDPSAESIDVGLFARVARDGTPRLAMHFGGDVMLGRRFLSPERPGTARVITGDGAASARAVVSDLAPLFAAADLSTVNLETVVGELGDDGAYPGKRYLLQSPPEVTGLLDALGVDLVTLGNNHVNDWQKPGVDSTVEALDSAGIAHVGAGPDEAAAQRGVIVTAAGVKVGVLSYTSVNGDFVNDSLPLPGEPRPVDLAPDDAWSYQVRTFGYGDQTQAAYLPSKGRLPSEAWKDFLALEATLDPTASAALWAALTAPGAYPELQDWVARRGHAGAAAYDREALTAGVAQLRDQGAKIVIVQLHAGFQFSEFTSEFTSLGAHNAIDAGADLVIGHHPHVLQGFEWYKGKLIAASLGNLVFDQDFLSTFSSVTMRVVMAGDKLIDARVIPLTIDGYRPVPVTGGLAQRTIRMLDARSASPARTNRFPSGLIAGVMGTRAAALATPATVTAERGTGVIGKGRTRAPVEVTLDGTGVVDLPADQLVESSRALQGLSFGRDLLGIGQFDDVTADGRSDGGVHWVVEADRGSTIAAVGDGDLGSGLALSLVPRQRASSLARPVARIARADHRFVESDGEPADGIASYTLRLSARRSGRVPLQARLDVFHVDDTDPNRDPSSTLIRRVRINVDVPNDGAWHRVEAELPPEVFVPAGGLTANTAMVHFEVASDATSQLDLDDVTVLEWRAADGFPADTWHEVDALRGPPGATVKLDVSR